MTTQQLENAIRDALGDGWSMDDPDDKAAAIAAILAALEAARHDDQTP